MFVILVMLVNLAGVPTIFGEYNAEAFPTMEACKANIPDVIVKIDAANPTMHVQKAECISREEADKMRDELKRKDSI